MKNRFYIAIFTTLFACTQSGQKVPENIIEKDKFVDVLEDLEKAEAYIHMQYAGQYHLKPEKIYLSVFEKHHITKADFDSSLYFYAANPEFLETAYNNILERIAKQQAEVTSKLSQQKEADD